MLFLSSLSLCFSPDAPEPRNVLIGPRLCQQPFRNTMEAGMAEVVALGSSKIVSSDSLRSAHIATHSVRIISIPTLGPVGDP